MRSIAQQKSLIQMCDLLGIAWGDDQPTVVEYDVGSR